jgi:hypothetical protein
MTESSKHCCLECRAHIHFRLHWGVSIYRVSRCRQGRERDLKRTNGRSRVPRRSAFQSDDQTKLQRCFCLFLHLDALTSSVELPQLAGWRNGLEELDDDMLCDGDGTACALSHAV